MSDVVLVSIIGGVFTLAGIILTHYLNRQDRALASDVVKTKDAELNALKAAHAAELAQRDSTIAWLRAQLDTRGVKA